MRINKLNKIAQWLDECATFYSDDDYSRQQGRFLGGRFGLSSARKSRTAGLLMASAKANSANIVSANVGSVIVGAVADNSDDNHLFLNDIFARRYSYRCSIFAQSAHSLHFDFCIFNNDAMSAL